MWGSVVTSCFLLLCLVTASVGIRCYSCNSHSAQCSVVHRGTPVINCQHGCAKLRSKSLFSAAEYIRGCTSSKYFRGCSKINLMGTVKEECDCRVDLCNAGLALTPYNLFLWLPLYGVKYFL